MHALSLRHIYDYRFYVCTCVCVACVHRFFSCWDVIYSRAFFIVIIFRWENCAWTVCEIRASWKHKFVQYAIRNNYRLHRCVYGDIINKSPISISRHSHKRTERHANLWSVQHTSHTGQSAAGTAQWSSEHTIQCCSDQQSVGIFWHRTGWRWAWWWHGTGQKIMCRHIICGVYGRYEHD